MTAHSGRGQGDPPLYEGVVLPANGDPWTPEQQRQVDRLQAQPSAGQPWGQPWGPESQAAIGASEDQPGPSLPPPPQSPPPPPPQQPPYIPPQQHSPLVDAEEAVPGAGGRHGGGQQPPPPPFPSADLPPVSVQPPQQPAGTGLPPAQPPQNPQAPQGSYLPEPHNGQVFGGGSQLPPQQELAQQQQGPGQAQAQPQNPQAPQGSYLPEPHNGQVFGGGSQLPPQQQPAPQPPQQPQQPPAGRQFGQSGPGAVQAFSPQGASTAMPPPAAPPAAPAPDADATQFIPPVAGAPSQPGQYQAATAPPVMDADATQMLPAQAGQAAARDPEATAQLRTPLPPEAPAGQGAGGGPGGAPGGRQQPPAGFENLFRSESPPAGGQNESGTGATQRLPLFDQAAARQRNGGVGGMGKSGAAGGPAGPAGAYGQGQGAGWDAGQGRQGRAARRNAERSALSRMSPALLIAVGVAVVAGVGMVAGAALSGGGEENGKSGSKSSPAPASEKSAGPDPVKAQAQELDKLLGDSNNSRAAVIRSVENIKKCKKLDRAAADLRAAADQRNSLVTRLGKLETDKIPADAELRSALTRAWKASASADRHYAAWADQTGGKKGCRKGKARPTAHTGQGARASGEATAAKKKAAGLWNPTAKKYGLKERQVVQL